MKILFISSGNYNNEVKILVRNQCNALLKAGLEVEYFLILGKGPLGYLRNIKKLKYFLSRNKFDIIHAHYSMSGYVAALAGANPLIVSLMGSDVYATFPWNKFINIFSWLFWDAVIVKSPKMKENIKLKKYYIIPNGVDTFMFKPMDKLIAKEKIGFSQNKKYIIFVADPLRCEKNYSLAREAIEILHNPDIELHVVSGISHELIPYYMNAADALILTSYWEGSVNVVKEAMACNLAVVSTDVGDVKNNFVNTIGYYITTYNPNDIANKLEKVLGSEFICSGRENIFLLGLDDESITLKLINLYKNIVKHKSQNLSFIS